MPFNFNINFAKIINDNFPSLLRQPRRVNRIKAMIEPFRIIYTDFIVKKDELLRKAAFNGSVISLETSLNDRFDPVNRAIFISQYDYNKVPIYRKSELRPPLYLYYKWNPATNYLIDKFVWYLGNVYQANTANVNKIPGIDVEWTLTALKAPVLRKASNFNGTIAFVVNVPATLVFNYNEMNALISYFKLAGRGYIMVTF